LPVNQDMTMTPNTITEISGETEYRIARQLGLAAQHHDAFYRLVRRVECLRRVTSSPIMDGLAAHERIGFATSLDLAVAHLAMTMPTNAEEAGLRKDAIQNHAPAYGVHAFLDAMIAAALDTKIGDGE
jgi:hypothetical protein